MDKVTKQKDPKRQVAGRKAQEKYVVKLKEDILKNDGSSNDGSSSSNSTNDSTNGSINTTNDSTSGGSDATSVTTSSTITNYIHGVGAIVMLSLGVCIFIIPKWMRNPPQPDKDPEKISKEPEKVSKIRRKML